MKNITNFILSIILSSGLISCGSMDSSFIEYVVPGGLKYPQKVTSYNVYPGRDSAIVTFQKGNDKSIVKYTVTYLRGSVADTIKLNASDYGDTISFTLKLTEGTYTATIRSYDSVGNVSVPVPIVVSTYGKSYQSIISNRPAIWFSDLKVRLGSTTAFITEVKYKNTAGIYVTKRYKTKVDTIIGLPDFQTELSWRSLHLPTALSIDTFYTDFSTKKMSVFTPFLSTGASASSTDGSNSVDRAFDADLASYWKSNTANSYPHWLKFDFGKLNDVSMAYLTCKTFTGAATSFSQISIEGSIDGTSWEPLGLFRALLQTDPQIFTFPTTSVRYIRLNLLKTANTVLTDKNAFLQDFKIYSVDNSR